MFWGLSAIKLDATNLKEAVKQRDALRAYMNLTRIADAARKLQKLLSIVTF